MERILELRRELEELLDSLPPEQRKEVERRWLQEQGSELVPEIAPPSPPTPVEETPPVPTPTTRPDVPPEPIPAVPACGTLAALDSNGDGVVSGLDRYWRYLSLWKDDGDSVVEGSELRSLYEHGVRRVSVRLFSYTTAKDADRGIWVEDVIYFELPGRHSRAMLTIDASRLARGGALWLEESSGTRAEGIQVLRSELDWVFEDGRRESVLCRSAGSG